MSSLLVSILSPVLLTILKPAIQTLVDKLMEHLSGTFKTTTLSQAASVAVLAAEEAAAYTAKTTGTKPTSVQKMETARTTVATITGESNPAITTPHIMAALANTPGAGATGDNTFGTDAFAPKE
jgi:hypothetical protein